MLIEIHLQYDSVGLQELVVWTITSSYSVVGLFPEDEHY